MRVDAVITWVDGADAAWRRRRERCWDERGTAPILPTANVEGRFRDHGELRFLLRSLERYWPFPGRIFIVTDAQQPAFLRTDHPRIRVVDHHEFIPARHLPTFSSRAIEASLHRIPGLAEHFVSFNDDFLLARPVRAEDFFGTAGCRVQLGPQPIPEAVGDDALSAEADACHGRAWMRQHCGASALARIPAHCPRGIRRSWMQELEAAHPELFESARSERFRRADGQSILVNIYPDWCLLQGRGEAVPDESLYLTSDELEAGELEPRLRAALGRRLCICINDTSDNREDVQELGRRYRALLQALFPVPSEFERTAAAGSN